jgi:hypothetical protein
MNGLHGPNIYGIAFSRHPGQTTVILTATTMMLTAMATASDSGDPAMGSSSL